MKKILLILLVVILTISVVPKGMQNDTLFTLAIGEKICNGEDVDALTWHEDIHFEHSGFFDIILYKIYNSFGFYGIYAFVALFAVLQMIIFFKIIENKTKNSILACVFTCLIAFGIKVEFTARAQVISFTLFLLEFYCIEKLIETNQKRYVAILMAIPLILANLHSSVFPMHFVFYVPYVCEWLVKKLKFKTSDDSKIIVDDIKITKIFALMFWGIIAGLCTPTGLCPFTDMFKGMSNDAIDLIVELQRLDIVDNIGFFVFISIVISILMFTKIKIKVSDSLYFLGFTLLSLNTARCQYFFYFFSTPIALKLIVECLKEYNIKFDINTKLKNGILLIFVVFVMLVSTENVLQNMNKEFIAITDYPVYAAEYILRNLDVSKMKIYNNFNFGSYLEFKGIPVFIDSRSGIYTPEFNKGVTVLSDFSNIVQGKEHYRTLFDKYEITHVLLYTNELLNVYIVDDEEWNLIYKDDCFSLYERAEK